MLSIDGGFHAGENLSHERAAPNSVEGQGRLCLDQRLRQVVFETRCNRIADVTRAERTEHFLLRGDLEPMQHGPLAILVCSQHQWPRTKAVTDMARIDEISLGDQDRHYARREGA